MKRTPKSLWLFLMIAVFAMMTAAGCGKKEKDPNSSEVMKLQITPEPTDIPEQEEPAPEAVTSKGSVKMVNEYLNQKIKEEAAKKRAEAEVEETFGESGEKFEDSGSKKEE